MSQNAGDIQPLLQPDPVAAAAGRQLVFRGLFWYVTVLTGLAIVAYLLVYWHTQIDKPWPFPFNSIVFAPSMRLSDFTQFYHKFQSFGTPRFWHGHHNMNYPAPDAYVYLLYFRLFPKSAIAAALAFDTTIVGIAVLAAGLLVWSVRKHQLVAPVAAILGLMLMTSYPLMFMADRANVEGAAWVMALVGAWAFVKNYGRIAAIFWGCVAAMKLAPLILIFLFLRRRDWRGAWTFVVAFFAINFVAMWFAAPHIAQVLHSIGRGIKVFQNTYVLTFSPAGIGVDHSLFSVVKQVLAWGGYVNGTRFGSLLTMIGMWYHVYTMAWLIAMVVMVWHFRRMPILNCVFAVFIVQVLAPGVSFDYTLLYMYIPWTMFVLFFLLEEVYSGRVNFQLWKILAILTACAILFTPQQCYMVLNGRVSFAGQFKALTLLLLLLFVASYAMPCRVFGEMQLGVEATS